MPPKKRAKHPHQQAAAEDLDPHGEPQAAVLVPSTTSVSGDILALQPASCSTSTPARTALARITLNGSAGDAAGADLSPLEALPDAILHSIFRFLGAHAAWETCRLALVSKRIASTLQTLEWPDLCLRHLQLPWDHNQLASSRASLTAMTAWTTRVRGGSLRTSALIVDLGDTEPPGSSAAISVSTIVASLQNLSCVNISQGDIATPATVRLSMKFDNWENAKVSPEEVAECMAQRHQYVSCIARSLAARSASSLVELSIRLKPPKHMFAYEAPTGSKLQLLLTALSRLPVLRKLDLVGYCDADEPFLEALAGATPKLKALGVMAISNKHPKLHCDVPCRSCKRAISPELASTIAKAHPLLEELRLVSREKYRTVDADVLREIGHLHNLRRLQLELLLEKNALDAFVDPCWRMLEAISLSSFDVDPSFEHHFKAPSLDPLKRLPTLRSLSLAESAASDTLKKLPVEMLATLSQLSSLAVGLSPYLESETSCFAKLTQLQSLTVRLSSDTQAGMAGLAFALASLTSLKELSLMVFDSGYLLPSTAALTLRAASHTLVCYHRALFKPEDGGEEMAALASCYHIREAVILISHVGPVLTPEQVEASLAPLGSLEPLSKPRAHLDLFVPSIRLRRHLDVPIAPLLRRLRTLLPRWDVHLVHNY